MRGALPIVMAEVSANERSMSGRESSTSDGNGTRVAGWQPPTSVKRTKSAPSPKNGVLSSSTVEKETLSKEQHKPIKDVPAKDKKTTLREVALLGIKEVKECRNAALRDRKSVV